MRQLQAALRAPARAAHVVLERCQRFEREGAAFPNDNPYGGYNEIIVSNDAWVRALPHSVEALFVIEGRENDWADVVSIHRRYLEAYGLTAAQFPLQVLRLDNWEEPFADYQER